MARSALERFLGDLLSSGAVTAAAAVIGSSEEIEHEAACGSTGPGSRQAVTSASLFDLASLTKPVVATVALSLDADGELPLRASVGLALMRTGFRSKARPEVARKSLGSLLRHRAGFEPWTPLFARCSRAELAAPWLATEPSLLGAAPGTYSDLGYILWGWLAERWTGRGLGELVDERLARPLGLAALTKAPGAGPTVVACGLSNARERELAARQGVAIAPRGAPEVGTPQDGNARFLGLSGHAGLFGSARSLWTMTGEWARPGRVASAAAFAAALRGRGRYALGWRRRPPEARGRSGVWYGHLGFTGGGAWFSPATGEVRVLLAHRSSVEVQLHDWRKRFLELPA